MRCYIGVAETQKTNATGKCESLRPCRPWIEEQCLPEPFRSGLMGVAEDADIWMFVLQERSSFFRQFPTFIQNMTDGDTAACQFDHGLGRKPALVIAIHIAGDGRATRYSDAMG